MISPVLFWGAITSLLHQSIFYGICITDICDGLCKPIKILPFIKEACMSLPPNVLQLNDKFGSI
jgi:hypothetical protein